VKVCSILALQALCCVIAKCSHGLSDEPKFATCLNTLHVGESLDINSAVLELGTELTLD